WSRRRRRRKRRRAVSTLDLDFPDRAAVLRRYFPSGRLGGLTVSGQSPFPVGSPVDLTLRIGDPKRTFPLPTRVAWSRFVVCGHTLPEYGLEFVTADKVLRDRFMGFLKE